MSGICDTCQRLKRMGCGLAMDGLESCDLYEHESRYERLFGTPERAANVILALQICPCVKDECAFCPACDVCFEHYKGGRTVYEMAEWLRGEA